MAGPVLRRVRVFATHLGLLAVLAFAAALLFTALPRSTDHRTDQGLREDVGALPHQARDLTFRADPSVPLTVPPGAAAEQLAPRERSLPGPLPGLIGDRWFAAKVGPTGILPSGPPPYAGVCRPELQVRFQTGYESEVRLITGRLPEPAGGGAEVIVHTSGDLPAGTVLRLTGPRGSVPVTVVGVFERARPAPFWDDLATVPLACPDPREGLTSRIVLLTDVAGVTNAGRATGVLDYEWRYAPAVDRLSTADLPGIVPAVSTARRGTTDALVTDLDTELSGFAERLRGVRALLAVVRAGLAATLFGLLWLAARLLIDRRRAEFALLRARGAAAGPVIGRTLRETAVVVPPAVLAGWALGRLVPGRAGPGAGWVLLLFGLMALLVAPLLAARPAGDRHERQDLAGARPSPRRLTVEIFVVLLAVLGVLLVRRRGLSPVDSVDPFLVSVPVLLGTATALVAVRLLPWPLRQIGRVAAKGRSVVPFLALARAGRGSAADAGAVSILVVAVVTGVFTASVDQTVRDARDRATDLEIAADARVDGLAFAPATADALAALPGVAAVAPVVVQPAAMLTSASGRRTQAQVLVVDGARTARTMGASRVDVPLPGVLRDAQAGGAAPAVLSAQLAAEIGAGGVVEVQGRRYAFRVAGVAETLPGLRVGARRFIALPWQALPIPDAQPLIPNRLLIAGDGFDPEALRAAGDEGQRANLSRVLGHPVAADGLPQRATVVTWAAERANLGRGGVNGVLGLTYTAGALGAAVLALAAIALTVLAGAPSRRRALTRLRTMGLSPGQGRRLLMIELAPLVTTALAAGGGVGVLLPRMIGPALGLDGFSAGVAGPIGLDPRVPAAAVLLLTISLVIAVAVETTADRWRLRK